MKIRVCILIMPLILLLSGCNLFSPKEYPEKELIVYTSRDSMGYIYSDKVLVKMSYSDAYEDVLALRLYADGIPWHGSELASYYPLTGEFEKVAWVDYNLFILCDGTYYSFDIKSYEIPPLDEDGDPMDPEYELKEYSESEFKELYPDWESFDWYGH